MQYFFDGDEPWGVLSLATVVWFNVAIAVLIGCGSIVCGIVIGRIQKQVSCSGEGCKGSYLYDPEKGSYIMSQGILLKWQGGDIHLRPTPTPNF